MAIQANRVAFGFDSRSANCVGSAGGVTIENYGHMHHVLRLCRQAVQLLDPVADNWGIGGQTSRDFLQRLPPLLASSQAGIVILRGPTNDRGAANMSAWDSIDTMNQIINLILGSGRRVILVADNPRGDTTFTSNRLNAAQLVNMQQVRRWMLSLDNGSTIRCCDPWPLLADPVSTTGDAKVGMTIDGLHDSPPGAFLVASVIAPILIQMFPGQQPFTVMNNTDLVSPSNLFGHLTPNPGVKLGGTAGSLGTGGSGTIAQSWSGTNSGTAATVTRTYSYDANGNQQIVLAGSASGTAAAADILRQSVLSNMVAGATYEAYADIDVDAGASNIGSIQLGIDMTDPVNGNVRNWDGDRYLGTSVIHSLADSGLWKIPPFVAPAGLTAANLRLTAYIVDNAASCALSMRVKSMWMRRVQT